MQQGLEVKSLTTIEDMKVVQKLEAEVWEMEPIPIHQTITAVKNGGIMLGAFYNGELVGFSYGFPGFDRGKSFLCSHMLGIHKNHRDKGIGALLKEAQKEEAIRLGYELIRWTFDPLQSRNGYLNLSKLKGICNDYAVNCYGEMEDGINKGLPSDRFNIEWWIRSQHVNDNLHNYSEPVRPFRWELTEEGFPILTNIDGDMRNIVDSDDVVSIPIPLQFNELKVANPALALQWRKNTRAIFQTFFSKGYTAFSMTKENEIIYMNLIKRDRLKLEKEG
ncbi:GNAT family N-acetyltransferase [Bacillus sp. CRN 9]|nr:GNAT family N-acetyltransferase [Bacillus sp. CRN 9]